MKDFLLYCRQHDPSEIVVHFNEKTYTTTSEPSIYEALDEMASDAESYDLEIYVEVPSENRFYRRIVSTEEVSPASVPGVDADLPTVSIRFNAWTLAPEYLVVEDEFTLKVLEWTSREIAIPNQRPSVDADYGLPLGTYRLRVQLPELPRTSTRTAQVEVRLDAEPHFSLAEIKAGRFPNEYDYSKLTYLITSADPAAYQVLQLMNERVHSERQEKYTKSILSQLTANKPLEDIVLPRLDQSLNATDDFCVSRTVAAYRFIYLVENEIRQFLWRSLKTIYKDQATTPNWWKGVFPEDIRKRVLERTSAKNPILDSLKAEATPLHYCTFNELGQLIEKEWSRIFSGNRLDRNPFFGHLSYLENIRNAIAHTRAVSDPELRILFDNGRSILQMLRIEIPRTTYKSILGDFAI